MNYISTRGKAPHLAFDDVLLAGLARDGGLYVPDAWPHFAAADIAALEGLPYAELATRVMTPFLGGTIAEDDFAAMVEAAYAGFDDPEVAPLRPLGDNEWLLELFHGPTLAFKDIALQLVGRLFDHVLGKRGGRVTIIGATSGATRSPVFRSRSGGTATPTWASSRPSSTSRSSRPVRVSSACQVPSTRSRTPAHRRR